MDMDAEALRLHDQLHTHERPAIAEAIEANYPGGCPETDDGTHRVEFSTNGEDIWCVECNLSFTVELPNEQT